MINNLELGSFGSGGGDPLAIDKQRAKENREANSLEHVIEYIRYFLVEEGVFDGEDGSYFELEKRLENDGLFVKDIISLVGELSMAQIQYVLMRAGCPEPAYFAQKIVGLKNEFDQGAGQSRDIIGSGGITYRQPGQMGRLNEGGQ